MWLTNIEILFWTPLNSLKYINKWWNKNQRSRRYQECTCTFSYFKLFLSDSVNKNIKLIKIIYSPLTLNFMLIIMAKEKITTITGLIIVSEKSTKLWWRWQDRGFYSCKLKMSRCNIRFLTLAYFYLVELVAKVEQFFSGIETKCDLLYSTKQEYLIIGSFNAHTHTHTYI